MAKESAYTIADSDWLYKWGLDDNRVDGAKVSFDLNRHLLFESVMFGVTFVILKIG